MKGKLKRRKQSKLEKIHMRMWGGNNKGCSLGWGPVGHNRGGVVV